MSAHAADPNAIPISERGPAPKEIVVAYGFWIFLLSDFVLFTGFFAAFAVSVPATAGGPGPRDIVELPLVATETALLLLSTFACGLAGVAMAVKRPGLFQLAMAATALLGAGFLAIEVGEFAHLIGQGNGPQRSAFLSSFFALVGCHGVHVTLGLVWLTTMMAQVRTKGFRADIRRRTACFMLFWHALDIVWVGIFTLVYLFGAYA
ncbi:MAG: cytochrome (ubi)quinol oxidase subunit III [Sphingomonas sp.]|uniref:cytochrome (ubi)quinol oxidase subunit III n=1 Tax=Sphingomonas sp. TaxID=28214 RepID=UPI001AC24DC0|nr:cytochrome (ubi)quinol oxidase subunit III [Sphingomonas sp.]MBN8808932.1 cytochrome (ubi)quinol oxidase subunit III [Sphingomonas sp.]